MVKSTCFISFCRDHNGFELYKIFRIAEKDLEIRGPGDIEGTKQSGLLNFKLANIVHDKVMLEAARNVAENLLETDPDIIMAENLPVKNYLHQQKGKTVWSKIS